jgi:hypothetical protein
MRAMSIEPAAQIHRARIMTRALRSSAGWSSFRDELKRRGLDPADVVLVDGFDDDEDVDVGLLYTSEKRLIAWRRAYSDDDPAADRILEWRDVTDGWASTQWSETAGAYLQAVEHTRQL